jgi:hypothetical protein
MENVQRKRRKQKLWKQKFPKSNKKQLKATPADWNKWKTEFGGSKTKYILKKKQKNS